MALIASTATYMLLNAASRTALDLRAGSQVNGTSVIGWDAHVYDGINVGKNQQWTATQLADKASDGSPLFSLQNSMGQTYLTIDNSTNGVQVVGRSQSNSDGQKWQFSAMPKLPSGGAQVNAYTVCSKLGNLCLDIDGGNRTNTAPVIATTKAGTSEQVWMLVVLQ